MHFHTESYTDKGLMAEINQDALLIAEGNRVSVLCIADGMGGHEHGEIASRMIVDGISEWHKTAEKSKNEESFMDLLDDFENKLTSINRILYLDYNKKSICGSTLVALLIYEHTFAIFSAGDSRIYRKHGFSFSQLTTDDVWQNQPMVKREFDSSQIKSNLNYGKLTKAVGVSDYISLSRVTGTIRKGDIFFLCCDGVYKYIEEKKLRKYVTKPELLKKSILSSGAPDNYSFISVVFDS